MQCRFRRGRSATDQIFSQQQAFERSWNYSKDIYASVSEKNFTELFVEYL